MSEFRVRRSFATGRAARPHGFTLAEVMVAIAVFAVIVAIAMTLYQQLQKSFKQGENATAEQQNTRIAFDRMMSDLRMAGFNYNPNGATRPDEQIEGMWTNAVTVRGDYDYETADANTPEPSLAGGAFSVVSTGNDEIVTYALGKPSGTGGTTIQFQADVSAVPRDGTLQTVPINNVYLDMNSPPYTLYRITLKPGGTALASMADKVPIADNIREMDVTYFDGAGTQLTTMALGMDDPNSLALRKKIAKINVRIVGMTQDPDVKYFDPTDTNPLSQHFRKFDLTSDVTPRNLGYVGMADLDLDKPTTPTGLAVCPGHCQGLYATWTANPANQGVIKYEVTSGAAIASMANPQDAYTTSYFVPNLTSASYMVGVAGVDAAGNKSDPPAYSPLTTITNSTIPKAPTGPTFTSVSGGNAVFNQINLGWAAPTLNTTNLGCDVSPWPIRDLKGFRLFRGATAGFDPNISAQVQISVDPNTITAGATTYSDPANPNSPTIVNCRPYFYKLRAEDLCGAYDPNVAAFNSASSSSSVKPSIPTNATALDMGNNSTLLSWNPVSTNVTPSPILIDKYKVFRTA
ncbi:MAG: prepilin-type N-terminal cleavage/methylation domain-containing protein, partial [Acidobacteria bacterium]|nr:prepilin-type N-terminal cleavage/methylation domain-containing protein [Acidobacteriota bacterium]